MKFRTLLPFLVFGTASPALAQTPDLVSQEKIKAKMEESAKAQKVDGWKYALDVGINGGFNHSSAVVGQPDGATVQFGAVINGSATLFSGQHEWHNTLAFAHQQTRTPTIDAFIKTGDNFELMTMWLYKPKVIPWLGPFARLRMQTQLFSGAAIFAEDKTLLVKAVDGTITTEQLAAEQERELTSPFEPLLLRQSLGGFARALDREDVKVMFTLGLGAQEIFTQDGLTVTDDDATPEVELTQLQDSLQLGVEAGAEANGTVGTQVTWAFSVNALYPFLIDADTDLEGADLMNVDINGKLGVKLAKWVSLDYVLSAKRIPLVLDDWQVQNGVLLSSSFNLL